jgi:hypothetical protein
MHYCTLCGTEPHRSTLTLCYVCSEFVCGRCLGFEEICKDCVEVLKIYENHLLNLQISLTTESVAL